MGISYTYYILPMCHDNQGPFLLSYSPRSLASMDLVILTRPFSFLFFCVKSFGRHTSNLALTFSYTKDLFKEKPKCCYPLSKRQSGFSFLTKKQPSFVKHQSHKNPMMVKTKIECVSRFGAMYLCAFDSLSKTSQLQLDLVASVPSL